MRRAPSEKHKTQKRHHRRLFGFVAACVMITYVSAVLLWPVQAIEASLQPLPTIPQNPPVLGWPTYGNSAVGTLDDGVLATDQTTQATMPIASITKVITALTVLEAKPLGIGQAGPVIPFTAADTARYHEYLAKNGSVARADAGMQLTQYQILQAMLIASANNYADSLALWAYGTPEAYLAAAQAYLATHQLSDTTVADMSGFSAESRSTASDLIQLGRLALQHPVVTQIVAQKSATIPGVGTLQNTNVLLGDIGVNGIKTGTTDEAGACLLFSAKHVVNNQSITIIGVVLGAPNHATLFRDARSLLEATKTNFKDTQLLKTGQVVATYTTSWGENVNVVTKQSLSRVLWPNSAVSQSTVVTALRSAPMSTEVGTVTATTNGKKYTTPAVLESPLNGPPWHWRLSHPVEVF